MLIVTQSLVYGIVTIPQNHSQWIRFPQSQAIALNQALSHTLPSTEIIASWAVIGRFSERQYVYPLYLNTQGFPVKSSTVEFVISTDNEPLTPAASLDIVTYIRETLHARMLASAPGVYVYVWHPPHATTSVVLS